MKDWSPEFHPEIDTIEEVEVYICVAGFPKEYYDVNILSIIVNRIGKIVKVDKSMFRFERGKYDRICVEVNLEKPLLAMFSIKGRMYKIEYEGIHLLCLACGRFVIIEKGVQIIEQSIVVIRKKGRMEEVKW